MSRIRSSKAPALRVADLRDGTAGRAEATAWTRARWRANLYATFWLWTASLVVSLVSSFVKRAALGWSVLGPAMMVCISLVLVNLGATVWRRRSEVCPLPFLAISVLWVCVLCALAWASGLLMFLGSEADFESARDAMQTPLLVMQWGVIVGPAIALASDILEARHGGLWGRRWIHTAIGWLVVGSTLPAHVLVELTTLVIVIGLLRAWVKTVLRSGLRGDPATLWALGLAPILLVAVSASVFLRSLSPDVHLHDSFFVVGSFHYMMGCAIVATAAALFAHWKDLEGSEPSRRLGRIGAMTTLAGLHLTFFSYFVVGQQGMPRRYQTYVSMFETPFRISSGGAALMFIGLVLSALALTKYASSSSDEA